MNKVKIKFVSGRKTNHEEFLKIISKCGVKCHKVQDIDNDNIFVWCNSLSDVDVLFSPSCTSALKLISCSPQLPPSVRAKRTILLRNVDDLIMKRSKSEIIEEIQTRNSWLRVADSFVFPSSPTIKLTCETNEMANNALNSGILLFNMSIPPANIAQEEYIHVTVCYKCYALEDHVTASCGKPKDYKVCSLCAATDHTYRQCTSSIKACINCGGKHGALAMSCVARKELVKAKRSTTQKHTYAAAIKGGIKSSEYSEVTGITNDVMAKAIMCITVATLKNTEHPGSFQETLDQLLLANRLPKFNMGNIIPPKNLGPSPMNTESRFGADVVVETLPSTQLSLSSQVSPSSETSLSSQMSPPPQASPLSQELSLPVSQRGSLGKLTLSQESKSITIYKRKTAGAVIPNTIEELLRKGNIVFKDQTLNDCDYIALISTMTLSEFSRVTNIIELKTKEFDQFARSIVTRPKRNVRLTNEM